MPDQYNNALLRLWGKHAAANSDLIGMNLFPIQRASLKINPDLLFIGMNPSFSKEIERKDTINNYRWVIENGMKNIPNLIAHENDALINQSYFKQLKSFAKAAGTSHIEHLDLLPVRHTNQSEIISSYWDKEEKPKDITRIFIVLFKQTLLRIKPKVVVVANAGAAKKIIDILNLESCDRKRSYRCTSNPEVPFFLSGMLSGQRALDNFSKDRLIADVNLALQPNPENNLT